LFFFFYGRPVAPFLGAGRGGKEKKRQAGEGGEKGEERRKGKWKGEKNGGGPHQVKYRGGAGPVGGEGGLGGGSFSKVTLEGLPFGGEGVGARSGGGGILPRLGGGFLFFFFF